VTERATRVVAVRAYWLLIVLVTVAAGPFFGAFVSINKANENARKAIAAQHRADEAAKAEAARLEEAARVESRRVACQFFALNLDVFDETPPAGPTGRNLRATYLEFYNLTKCQPPRK
jgi:hypothetical protein